MINQKFIYFPSFSSKYSLFKKDELRLGDIETIRFYDDRFPKEFRHKYFLLTAAEFYNKKTDVRKDMGLENSLVFVDSGGFQIANSSLEWSLDLRDKLFQFIEAQGDIGMNLDIPPKLKYAGKFEECLEISYDNFKYFHEKQSGKTKFLNVIQADSQVESYGKWYDKVKCFDDFSGWGVGSILKQHYNALYVTALFLQNREFERKNCEYVHFLGATNPFNFLTYAVLQKNLNKYYPHVRITTDSSTPLLQPVYGNWAHTVNYKTWNFNYLWVGNKGSVKYVEDAHLPCQLGNCPVCSNITYNEIANYKSHTIFALHVGWHNLFVFVKNIQWISELVYGGNDVVGGFFTKDIVSFLKSVDEMFEKPDQAMIIFNHNKKLYQELSNKLEKEPDPELIKKDSILWE